MSKEERYKMTREEMYHNTGNSIERKIVRFMVKLISVREVHCQQLDTNLYKVFLYDHLNGYYKFLLNTLTRPFEIVDKIKLSSGDYDKEILRTRTLKLIYENNIKSKRDHSLHYTKI